MVTGGSRQAKNGVGSSTYTGTHYIDISGGRIDKLYGGPLEEHTADSLVCEITGGEIGAFYVSGDENRRLNGTAKITLSGGSIDTLECYGVMSGSTIELCGGKVEKLGSGYPSGRLEYLRLQSGGEAVLEYDGSIYSKEEIAEYTGFDRIIDVKAPVVDAPKTDDFAPVDGVVFVSGDGSGNGESPMKALSSLEKAYSKLAKTGGTIVICGKYEHRTETKFANDKKVTVTSVYGGVDYAKENGAEILFFGNFFPPDVYVRSLFFILNICLIIGWK